MMDGIAKYDNTPKSGSAIERALDAMRRAIALCERTLELEAKLLGSSPSKSQTLSDEVERGVLNHLRYVADELHEAVNEATTSLNRINTALGQSD